MNPRTIAIFTLISWLGEYVHNLVDLPQLTALSPENSIPAIISVLLFFLWWKAPQKRLSAGVFLVWGLIQLMGGIISVLPLPFLPFVPAQTPLHYFMHVIYALAQLPLIIALWRELSNSASHVREPR